MIRRPLQGVCSVLLAVRVVCRVWSGHAVPSVLLQALPEGDACGAVRVVCVLYTRLWNGHAGERMLVQGAARGAMASCTFPCRVLLSDFSQKQQEA